MTTKQAAIMGTVLFGLAHFDGEKSDLGLTDEELDWAAHTIEVRFGGDLDAVYDELAAAADLAEVLCTSAERAS